MYGYRDLIAEEQGVDLYDIYEVDDALYRSCDILNKITQKFIDGKISLRLFRHQIKRILKIIDILEGR